MQDDGQIARAFAAWQSTYQKLCEAEVRLATANQAHQQGLIPCPEELRSEVLRLKAEQDWRYQEAAQSLHRRNTQPETDRPSPASTRPGLPGGSSAQPA